MKAEELANALRQFDSLARDEYHESLAQVVSGTEDAETRLLRLGRLIGVILKEPFATPKVLESPSSYSRAYRSWELKPEAVFQDPNIRASWQFHTLEALRSNPEVIRSLGWEPSSVYDLAKDAQVERGFFGYLAVSCRKYLCGGTRIRNEIERGLQAAKSAGVDLKKNITPEVIVGSGGLAIGAALVQHIPALGMVGAPVIAGLVFIIYSIGIDAFCGWASQHDLRNADKEK